LGSADDGVLALVYPGEMLPDLVAALALAFPIVAAAPGVEGPCPGYYDDPCEDVARWVSLQAHNADKIPSDGVLVLQGAHPGLWDESVTTRVDVQIELDLQPVTGVLELGPVRGVLVWRPDAPWIPGAPYHFSVTATPADDGSDCGPPTLTASGDLTVDSEPGAPLKVPVLAAEVSVYLNQNIGLDSMACCEGEAPAAHLTNCGYDGVVWDPAVCTSIRGTGFLSVIFTGLPAAEGPAAQQIVYTRKADGLADRSLFEPVFGVELPGPFCVELEARDLASGKLTTSGRQCFGEDVADKLGSQPIEPPEELTCSLQRCEPTEFGWDLERCMPHEPPTGEADAAGEGEGRGCGCVVSSAGDTGLLALIGLLGLARRRRVSGRRA